MQEYWYKHEAYTYVLLDSPERKAEIEREFPVMAEKYKTDEALKNKTWGVSLIPLADIHLTPQVGYEAETKGNRSSMIALIFAAIAILAIRLLVDFIDSCFYRRDIPFWILSGIGFAESETNYVVEGEILA